MLSTLKIFNLLMVLSSMQVVFSKMCSSDVCKNTQSFSTSKGCYCGEEAKKLLDCVKSKSPNWPFLPAKEPQDKKCPSPVDDSNGFKKCMDDKMPKKDPKSNEYISECEKGRKLSKGGSFFKSQGASFTSTSSGGITSTKTIGAKSMVGKNKNCGNGKKCLKSDASINDVSSIVLVFALSSLFLLFK